MVEELACLIKDNLPCKHLVLSTEATLVDFLKDDTSLYGVLVLEPMSSYNRLLLHRLADIFGFSHQSVGEGEDRHLIFERSPETSVPSILVSDLLWQYDDVRSPSVSHLLLRRCEASPELEKKRGERGGNEVISLEERETAYLAARHRIFSTKQVVPPQLPKQKPQNNPVVARRMIAHALGQTIPSVPINQVKEKNDNNIARSLNKKEQKLQQIGAAKRMFANALGIESTRQNDIIIKSTTRELDLKFWGDTSQCFMTQ
jgi:hypothetical protein